MSQQMLILGRSTRFKAKLDEYFYSTTKGFTSMLPDDSVPVRAWFQQVSRTDYSIASGEHASETGSGQVQIRVSGVSGHHGVLQAWFTEPVPEDDVTNHGGRPEYRRGVHYLDANNTECVAEDVRFRRALRGRINEFHLFNGVIDIYPFSEEGRSDQPEGDGPYPLHNVLVEDQDGVLWAGVLTLDEIQERFGEEFREHVDALRDQTRVTSKVYAVYPSTVPIPAVTEEHVEADTETTSATPSSVGTSFAANPATAHNSAVRRRLSGGNARRRTTGSTGASNSTSAQSMEVYIGHDVSVNEAGDIVDVNPMIKCGQTNSANRENEGATDRPTRDLRGNLTHYVIRERRFFPARRWGEHSAETEFHARLSQQGIHSEVGLNGQREWFFGTRLDGSRIDHDSTPEERVELFQRALTVLEHLHAECEEE